MLRMMARRPVEDIADMMEAPLPPELQSDFAAESFPNTGEGAIGMTEAVYDCSQVGIAAVLRGSTISLRANQVLRFH